MINMKSRSVSIHVNFDHHSSSYRPGQPIAITQCGNSEDFSATQILRENNFGHFEDPETVILSI